MNFTATTRKAQGTGASRRLRRENKLPGIVYGNDQAATPIVLDHNPIFYALRKEAFHSSVLTLNLDGVDQLVVLRSFQLHPYKQQVLHIAVIHIQLEFLNGFLLFSINMVSIFFRNKVS